MAPGVARAWSPEVTSLTPAWPWVGGYSLMGLCMVAALLIRRTLRLQGRINTSTAIDVRLEQRQAA